MEIGKHPLIARMLKGVFNERPPRPKYEYVWKVDQVLNYLKKEGPTEPLSLQCLTLKMVTLFVLTHPSRGADLAELDLNNRFYTPEEVVFKPNHRLKQSRSSHHNVDYFFQCLRKTSVCSSSGDTEGLRG